MTYKQSPDDFVRKQIDEAINLRLLKKFPIFFMVDGGSGEGKTTFAVHCANYINQVNGLPPITLEPNNHPQLACGAKEFIAGINKCRELKLPVIIYDEAADFSKKTVLSKMNAMISQTFDIVRQSNIIVFIVLINFNRLDDSIFETRGIRGLFHCWGRQYERQKRGNYWAYSLYQINWVRHWYSMLARPIRQLAYRKTIPNYHGHFFDLEPEMAKALANISQIGKKKLTVQAQIRAEGLYSKADLANALGRTIYHTQSVMFNERIKWAKKINGKTYYTEDTLKFLKLRQERLMKARLAKRKS